MILFLFFCSGATALIYEVVWSKYLSLMFGSTIYAQTVVLAVFMGGLALGNRLIGARSDLLRKPLGAYGKLELIIGLYAFCFSWIYQGTDHLFVAAGSRLIDYPAALLVWKAALSVGLLLLPTVLMGGTLPLLAAWLQKQSNDAGRWAARFYSINSLGAVCGAFLAGFFLIRILGLVSSLQVTALVNVLIGFTAIGFSKKGFDEVEILVSPHPGPLPRGEGESSAVGSRKNPGENDVNVVTDEETSPSPPGEERVGERRPFPNPVTADELSLSPRERAGVRGNFASEPPIALAPTHGSWQEASISPPQEERVGERRPFGISSQAKGELSAAAGRQSEHTTPASLILLVALTGGVSMGLEILASRSLSLIFGASVQAFAIVLMAFILGIGLGSAAIASPRLKNRNNESLIFMLLLIAAGVVGFLVLGIEKWVEAYRYMLTGLGRTTIGYLFYQIMAGGFSIVILGIPAALIGAVLPLCIRLVSGWGERFLCAAEQTSLSPRERAGVRGNSAFELPNASDPTTAHGERLTDVPGAKCDLETSQFPCAVEETSLSPRESAGPSPRRSGFVRAGWVRGTSASESPIASAGIAELSLSLPQEERVGERRPFDLQRQLQVDLGNQVGRLLTWNTLGAVVGVVLTGFVLMPHAGLRNAFNLLAMALCLSVVAFAWSRRKVAFACAGGLLASALLVSCVAGGEGWRYVMSSGVFRDRGTTVDPNEMSTRKKEVKLLFYEDAADGTVSVEQRGEEGPATEVVLRISGKPDASNHGDLSTQLLLGHLPMLMRPESKDVFAFGLGSGITASAFLNYPIEHLTIAENCEPVVRAARLFTPWNLGVITNTLTRIRIEDARTVLKLARQNYDVIVSEPSNPWFASVGSVFTREFYELAAARLKPAGLMVQWFHMYEMHDGIVDLVLRTFQSVFPVIEVWEGHAGDIILIGSARPWSCSLEKLRQSYQRDSVRESLTLVGLRTPEELLARQFASQRTAFAIPGDGPVQSDIFPVLEYEAPRAFFIGASAAKITRFDERTWQAPFASQEKRAALTNFSDASLRFAFTNGTVNTDLWDAIVARLKRPKDRPSVVSLTTAVPCLFSISTNTIEEPLPAKMSEDLKQLYRARASLQGEGTDWAAQVQTVRRILLAELTPGATNSVGKIGAHFAGVAARACMVHNELAQSKQMLEIGSRFIAAEPELAYLSRLLQHEVDR